MTKKKTKESPNLEDFSLNVYNQIGQLFHKCKKEEQKSIFQIYEKFSKCSKAQENYIQKNVIFSTHPPGKITKRFFYMIIFFLLACIFHFFSKKYYERQCKGIFQENVLFEDSKMKLASSYFHEIQMKKQKIKDLDNKKKSISSKLVPYTKKKSLFFKDSLDTSKLTENDKKSIQVYKNEIDTIENEMVELEFSVRRLSNHDMNSFHSYFQKLAKHYRDNIDLYKKQYEECMEKSTIDELYLHCILTLVVIGIAFDRSIFQFLIEFLPYGKALVKEDGLDGTMSFIFVILYFYFYVSDTILPSFLSIGVEYIKGVYKRDGWFGIINVQNGFLLTISIYGSLLFFKYLGREMLSKLKSKPQKNQQTRSKKKLQEEEKESTAKMIRKYNRLKTPRSRRSNKRSSRIKNFDADNERSD